MKNFKLWSIVLLTLVFTVSCKKDPKSDKEKVSYAIGQQIGTNLKQQEIDVDVKMLAQAIEEARSGKESRMSQDDMRKAMMDLQKQKNEERKKQGEENVKKGNDFLEANKKKDGVKVTDSGLQYKILKEGTGKQPKEDSIVSVHYKGTLIDGTEFDSSYKRDKPAEFPVGGVIKGWTEALQLMKEGAKWELYIPSDLAYGAMGRPSIPPNSVLVFEVELLKIVDKEKAK
ncbi:MAG: FKBP-type peptidyl-prolyl cis-trans isomerase [Bdellovibrionales bacterium]|nr:FKBP-type peptidyl-prolyl cis-trans isomerase [Bdellovibrionales bacterium]